MTVTVSQYSFDELWKSGTTQIRGSFARNNKDLKEVEVHCKKYKDVIPCTVTGYVEPVSRDDGDHGGISWTESILHIAKTG